ncbi:MAG: uridine kinase, partial [Akkermansiaceae bacterium]
PRIVMVEGNYLLLDDEPWCRLREQVFDETWFLDVPVAECMRRIYQRHLTTGQTAEGAQRRVATNDSINADLVIAASVGNADRVLRICQLGTL